MDKKGIDNLKEKYAKAYGNYLKSNSTRDWQIQMALTECLFSAKVPADEIEEIMTKVEKEVSPDLYK